MGLFSNLLSKVLGQQTAATPSKDAPAAGATPGTAASGAVAASGVSASSSGATSANVDVTAILDDLASKNPEKLDWRRSIVDLMKLVDMDSSITARKELAKDLSYTGDTGDSAKMNIWLHKTVIRKIADNGGKVPNELLT